VSFWIKPQLKLRGGSRIERWHWIHKCIN
jgi:hypothetical protein